MVRVEVHLDRGAWFAGDLFRCFVRLYIEEHKPGSETLEFVTLQVHGQITGSPDIVKPTVKSTVKIPSGGTALPSIADQIGPNSAILFSTAPHILLCARSLEKFTTTSFGFECHLPPYLPPTYKGTNFRFDYALTIGAKKMKEEWVISRMPIRLLGSVREDDASLNFSMNYNTFDFNIRSWEGHAAYPTNETVLLQQFQRFDSFSESDDVDDEDLAPIPSVFNISKEGSLVARCSLFQHSPRVGEGVTGFVDFTNGTVPCYQVKISLTVEETAKTHTASSIVSTQVLAEDSQNTLHTLTTHFFLPLPLDSPPQFTSEFGSVSYFVVYRFITVSSSRPKLSPGSLEPTKSELREYLTSSQVDTLEWKVPVTVGQATTHHDPLQQKGQYSAFSCVPWMRSMPFAQLFKSIQV